MERRGKGLLFQQGVDTGSYYPTQNRAPLRNRRCEKHLRAQWDFFGPPLQPLASELALVCVPLNQQSLIEFVLQEKDSLNCNTL